MMKKLSETKMEELLGLNPIDRKLQNEILQSVKDALAPMYQGAGKFEFDEYVVNGTSRTNATLHVFIMEQPVLSIIYLEHYRCFHVSLMWTIGMVGMANNISDPYNYPHLFPDNCFARSAQEIVDSVSNQIQFSFNYQKQELHNMSESEKNDKIDAHLDARDFDAIRFMDTLDSGEIIIE
jgi:hypothetical protein